MRSAKKKCICTFFYDTEDFVGIDKCQIEKAKNNKACGASTYEVLNICILKEQMCPQE